MSQTIKQVFFSILMSSIFSLVAAAQVTRVYVAANTGDDSNLCTQISQCKTITHALTVADAGGQVILTENGDYDKFFIAKSITVAAAAGVNAGIVSGGGSAISIAGVQVTDSITLRNLHLIGIGGQVSDGIINSFAGTMIVDDCTFTNFNNALTMSNVLWTLIV